jgi:hypothetical protein
VLKQAGGGTLSEMNLYARMEAIQILQHLTDDDLLDYEAEQAARLIALLPLTKRMPKMWALIKKEGRRSNFSGFSPGIGNIDVSDKEEDKNIALNQPDFFRIGDFRVSHNFGAIFIGKMWEGTGDVHDAKVCLTYSKVNPSDGYLTKLLIPDLYYIFGVKISIFAQTIWKLPRGTEKLIHKIPDKYAPWDTFFSFLVLLLVIQLARLFCRIFLN